MEDSEELLNYQPKRIAEFLSFPSMKIRTAASLTLAERQSDRDPQPWVGVAPKLIRAYAIESEPVARECARYRAGEPAARVAGGRGDGGGVRAGPGGVGRFDADAAAALLEKAVQARPELRPDVIDWSLELLESSDVDERRRSDASPGDFGA